jgi:predicted nuclease of predicted toxin-antitoxin system
MKPRFLADENFNHLILKALRRREPNIDIANPHETGLKGLDDLQVLQRASAHGRILLTHDIRTMPRHFAEFLMEHDSPGLVIVPHRLRVGAVVEDLMRMWSETELEDWRNRIIILPWVE